MKCEEWKNLNSQTVFLVFLTDFFLSFQYTIILILVFILESAIGGLAYLYETQIADELNATLSDTFKASYGVDESRSNAIDTLQQSFGCCGAIRFEEFSDSQWLRSRRTDLVRSPLNRTVPDSCCITFKEGCGKRNHPSNIHYTVSFEKGNWRKELN